MTADIQRTNSLAAILRPGFLVEFCRRWRVRRLELFGSAATGELRPGSDLDFLITFHLGAEWSLLDHVRMKQELETLTGRKVDLMTRRSLEQSHNSLLREAILGSVRVVYSADEALDAAG
jgi:predicted nucleotidyltransferase